MVEFVEPRERIELSTSFLPRKRSADELPRLVNCAESRIRTYAALSSERFTVSCDCPLHHLGLFRKKVYEPTKGFGPSTPCLQNRCSTTELHRHNATSTDNYSRMRLFLCGNSLGKNDPASKSLASSWKYQVGELPTSIQDFGRTP